MNYQYYRSQTVDRIKEIVFELIRLWYPQSDENREKGSCLSATKELLVSNHIERILQRRLLPS